MFLKRAAIFLLDLLFPPRCVFCGQIIPPGKMICAKCGKITPLHDIVRINAGPSGKNIPCTVLYNYTGNVRKSIIRFKFYGEKRNAVFYAKELSKQIDKCYGENYFDIVTCVPVSSERLKSRGYNQSELIARGISASLGMKYADCLIKLKDNAQQHFLGKEERRRNVKGVYGLSCFDVSSKKVLLIDDIVTTGSTMSECAKVLLTGGAQVCCAAISLAIM